jgi:hypothetical protein
MQQEPIFKVVAEAHYVYRLLAGLFAVTLIVNAQTGPSSSSGADGNASSSVVANVSGSGPFTINGASLSSSVPSWPVMSGDQIATGSAPAVITLPDGTQLDLDPNSKVTITIQNGLVKVFITVGGCHGRHPDPHHHWCWIEPATTSDHRCGGRYHYGDQDGRCCPGADTH